MKLSPAKFRTLSKNGYSTDLLYLLECIDSGYDISGFNEPKEQGLIQTLFRKSLVNSDNAIAPEGTKLLEYIQGPEDDAEFRLGQIQSADIASFDLWWQAYPGTDSIIQDKKIIMKGSRSIRADKEGCKVLFLKILAEKVYTAEQIIAALEYEVHERIKKSIRTKSNNLSFMKNSKTYLNQRAFEAFIELIEISGENTSSPLEDITPTNGVVGI